MVAPLENLKVLMKPCNSGMCPALYEDADGRVFVQGNRLSEGDRTNLSVATHEDIVEISPELISFIRSQV